MFLDLPLGHTTGLPHDRVGQRRILSEGLAAAVIMAEPGTIHELDYRYVDDDWKAEPLSWSRKRQARRTHDGPATPAKAADAAGESKPADTRTPRSPNPVYQHPDDAVAAEQTSFEEQCLVCIGIAPTD